MLAFFGLVRLLLRSRFFLRALLFPAALHQRAFNGLALLFRQASVAVAVIALQHLFAHLLNLLELLGRGLLAATFELLRILSLRLRASALLGLLRPHLLGLLGRGLLGTTFELLRTLALRLRASALLGLLLSHLLHVLALLGQGLLSATLELLRTLSLKLWASALLGLLLPHLLHVLALLGQSLLSATLELLRTLSLKLRASALLGLLPAASGLLLSAASANFMWLMPPAGRAGLLLFEGVAALRRGLPPLLLAGACG